MIDFKEKFLEHAYEAGLDDKLASVTAASLESWLNRAYSILITNGLSGNVPHLITDGPKENVPYGNTLLETVRRAVLSPFIPGPVFYIVECRDFEEPFFLEKNQVFSKIKPGESPTSAKKKDSSEKGRDSSEKEKDWKKPIYISPCTDSFHIPPEKGLITDYDEPNKIDISIDGDELHLGFPFKITDNILNILHERYSGEDLVTFTIYLQKEYNSKCKEITSCLRASSAYYCGKENEILIDPVLENFNDNYEYDKENLVLFQKDVLIKNNSTKFLKFPVPLNVLKPSEKRFRIIIRDPDREFYKYKNDLKLYYNNFLSWNLINCESKIVCHGENKYFLKIFNIGDFGDYSEILDIFIVDDSGRIFQDYRTILNPDYPYIFKLSKRDKGHFSVDFSTKPDTPATAFFKVYNNEDYEDYRKSFMKPDKENEKISSRKKREIKGISGHQKNVNYFINSISDITNPFDTKSNTESTDNVKNIILDLFKHKMFNRQKLFTTSDIKAAAVEYLSMLSFPVNSGDIRISKKMGRRNGYIVPFIEVLIVSENIKESNNKKICEAVERYLHKGLAVNNFVKVKARRFLND